MSTFGVKVSCSWCAREVEGTIVEDNLRITDSPGFLIFDSELVCDDCMTRSTGRSPTEPAFGPDYPKEKK